MNPFCLFHVIGDDLAVAKSVIVSVLVLMKVIASIMNTVNIPV